MAVRRKVGPVAQVEQVEVVLVQVQAQAQQVRQIWAAAAAEDMARLAAQAVQEL